MTRISSADLPISLYDKMQGWYKDLYGSLTDAERDMLIKMNGGEMPELPTFDDFINDPLMKPFTECVVSLRNKAN